MEENSTLKRQKLNIPIRSWGKLQKGETVEVDGVTFTPDMVVGAPRKGLKVTYTTDTRPVPVIAEAAKGADLLYAKDVWRT